MFEERSTNKNTECLDEFISKGGWSNWLMSMDGLVASKKIMPYHLLLAIKWTMKLHKLLIDTGQGYCVNNIFNLTDGKLRLLNGKFETNSSIHHTCYIVEHLDKNTSDGCLNRSLIDGKLKIEIRRNMIRIYNSFKMDSLCRQRTADEIKTFAKTFYVLLCKLEVFDRKFYDPSCVSLMGKVDNCFLKENNLSDIYELESYLATIDVIKAKLTDDFIHISVYMSKLQYQTTHFAELVYLMQFAELVNLLNLVDDERQWCELFLFQLNIFASLYLNKVNGTSASILRLFLLISLKNDRLDAFNGFKKNHFEGKFRQNLPFLSDGQLTEMKALVEDKLN
uniref:Uncharacterized protein n=1 Tax=Romanomermis culicivorax TaxID=13658 RepID=A0A915K0D6_ROMCU